MCISVLVVGLPVKVGLAQAQLSTAPHRTRHPASTSTHCAPVHSSAGLLACSGSLLAAAGGGAFGRILTRRNHSKQSLNGSAGRRHGQPRRPPGGSDGSDGSGGLWP